MQISRLRRSLLAKSPDIILVLAFQCDARAPSEPGIPEEAIDEKQKDLPR